MEQKTKAPVSWRPEVVVELDGQWTANAQRFATRDEAEAAAHELMMRWTLVRAVKAAPSDDPVNARWDFDKRVALDVEAGNGS